MKVQVQRKKKHFDMYLKDPSGSLFLPFQSLVEIIKRKILKFITLSFLLFFQFFNPIITHQKYLLKKNKNDSSRHHGEDLINSPVCFLKQDYPDDTLKLMSLRVKGSMLSEHRAGCSTAD